MKRQKKSDFGLYHLVTSGHTGHVLYDRGGPARNIEEVGNLGPVENGLGSNGKYSNGKSLNGKYLNGKYYICKYLNLYW